MKAYESIEFKIIAVIISIFTLIAFPAIYFQYTTYKKIEARKHKDNLAVFEQARKHVFLNYRDIVWVYFNDIVVKDRGLQAAMRSGDEYEIEDNTVPDYNRLKVEVPELTAMTFYSPDGVVLRREHSDKKGDKTNRPLVLKTIDKNMSMSGIEEDDGAHLLFITASLSHRGKIVGYVKVGMNFDAIIEQLRQFTNIQDISFVFGKESQPVSIKKTENGIINAIYQLPLNNFSGKRTGFIQLVSDITAKTARAQRNIFMQVVFVAILAIFVCLFLALAISRIVLKPIQVLVDATRSVSLDSDNSHLELDESRNDEFGQLSMFFNDMLERIYIYNDWNKVQHGILKEARDKARKATKAKSVFLANMSHELRTPLNAIIGYSEMLQEEAEDAGHEDLIPDLKKINAAGKHLLELIKDILDLSKIEAGRMDLHLENFDVSQLIQEIADTVTPLMEENNNTLKLNCATDIGIMRSDVTKLRQTLFNLLSNACKFTKDGVITIGVASENNNGTTWINISVSDTGLGIDHNQLNKIFEAFSQANSSTTRDFGGTGLGLAISRRFCEMMGGDITVESKLGKGSNFTIKLPSKGEQPDIQDAVWVRLHKDPNKNQIDERRKEVSQVLVIDDDPAIRDMLKRFFSKEGFLTNTASDGEEGLRRIKSERPDVIVLDIMMPRMDGWAVLKTLKDDPELSDIPVTILSVLDDMNMGYALGATDYLTKPIDWGRLLNNVKKCTRRTARNSILVVGFDNNILGQAKGMMEKEKLSVVAAKNGREAIECVAKSTPSLILLELTPPKTDGFEFIIELRKTKKWKLIPIIVVSGSDLSAEDKEKLDGHVEYLSGKGMYGRNELLSELKELICDQLRQATTEHKYAKNPYS